MSLKYTYDKGHGGEKWSGIAHYAQTCTLPAGASIVKCSGQGGWDSDAKLDANDTEGQVKQAFLNVERVLREAGCRGWEDVYSLRSYHVDIDASFDFVRDGLKSRLPERTNTWTAVQVARLSPGMLIELEVEAYKQDP